MSIVEQKHRIIEGEYLRDILDQPRALTGKRYRQAVLGAPSREMNAKEEEGSRTHAPPGTSTTHEP